MKKIWKLLILIISVAVSGFLFFYFSDIVLSPASLQRLQNRVCLNSNCFLVELAKTNAEKQQGLMYRKELEKNKGMLFIFDEEGSYPFWMKNTLIPLDIIWIDSGSKIVFINENTKPCDTNNCPLVDPNVKARYVLEINAGIVKELGIKTGDVLQIGG